MLCHWFKQNIVSHGVELFQDELDELIEKLKARIEMKNQKKLQNKLAPATSSIV